MFMLKSLVVPPLERYGSEVVLPILGEERLSDARRCWWSPTLSAAWVLVSGVVEVEVGISPFSEKLSHLRRDLFMAGRQVQHGSFRSSTGQKINAPISEAEKASEETRHGVTSRDV